MGNLIKNNSLVLPKYPSLFDDFFTKDWLGKSFETSSNIAIPAVNVKESEDGFSLEVAAPGFTREDFNLELNNEVLTISAEKKQEEKEGNGKYSRREFNYSSFKRKFVLDRKFIDSDKISANYKDGILYVTVPKMEEAKIKKVKQIDVS